MTNPTNRLNKEIVNQRLKGSGIELIGEYVNTSTKSLFRCSKGHERMVFPDAVFRFKKCSNCSGEVLSKEIVNERLKNRNVQLIGEYINMDTKALFKCSENHEWETIPYHVLGKAQTGCRICNGGKLSKKIVNQRLKDRGIELIGEYTNVETKSLFRCSESHEWTRRVDSVMDGGKCPECFSGKRGGGIKTDKPSHAYILNFGNFLKFGISNVLEKRLKTHRQNNGEHVVIASKLFENGQDALDWENSIKKRFGGNYVSKDIFPYGFTETLPICLKEALVETL
jgi:hypothetical protein